MMISEGVVRVDVGALPVLDLVLEEAFEPIALILGVLPDSVVVALELLEFHLELYDLIYPLVYLRLNPAGFYTGPVELGKGLLERAPMLIGILRLDLFCAHFTLLAVTVDRHSSYHQKG